MIRAHVAVFLGALAVIPLAGCTQFSTSGSGMMGSNSSYYSSPLGCKIPSNLSGTLLHVTLGDMGMTRMMGGIAPRTSHMRLLVSPASAASGAISIVVSNLGWRAHELVVMPLLGNHQAGERVPLPDGKVDETGSIGEASHDCGEGTGEGIKAGSAGWVTLNLKPGRYEFICNLQNHYADGMFQEVDIS